jgi:hypothetical protein
MKLTQEQLAELEEKGLVTIHDDAYLRELGGAAALDMLGVALARLEASAARHNPRRCPDCGCDVENGFALCDECAARRHELDSAA